VTLGLAQEMLRLLGAAVVGAIIGINRDIAGKPIGLRTLALVALAAAIATIAAIEVPGIGGSADALSRVIQGVIQGIMTGISFIGAGVVLRDTKSRTVEGLTTASTVWIAAALGIACGLGAWTVAVTGTILALVFLVLFEWLEVRFGIGKAKKEE
jgi:putative Mg2+ transporter-C (MgtC) family protein